MTGNFPQNSTANTRVITVNPCLSLLKVLLLHNVLGSTWCFFSCLSVPHNQQIEKLPPKTGEFSLCLKHYHWLEGDTLFGSCAGQTSEEKVPAHLHCTWKHKGHSAALPEWLQELLREIPGWNWDDKMATKVDGMESMVLILTPLQSKPHMPTSLLVML